MLDLESAIKHCEEVADRCQLKAYDVERNDYKDLQDCADDHRQLAEWLTELTERRKAEPQEGEWENITTCTAEEAGMETLQQMRCSVCKRWHTEPYIYYVTPSNYCPNCGAKMKKG